MDGYAIKLSRMGDYVRADSTLILPDPPKPARPEDLLTCLLDDRNLKQRELDRSIRNVDEFVAAVQIMSHEASTGRPAKLETFPPGVAEWHEKLSKRHKSAPAHPGNPRSDSGEKVCSFPGCETVITERAHCCNVHGHMKRAEQIAGEPAVQRAD